MSFISNFYYWGTLISSCFILAAFLLVVASWEGFWSVNHCSGESLVMKCIHPYDFHFKLSLLGHFHQVAASLTAFISSYLMGGALISQPLFWRGFSDETYTFQRLSFQTSIIGSLWLVVASLTAFISSYLWWEGFWSVNLCSVDSLVMKCIHPYDFHFKLLLLGHFHQ